MEEFDEEEERIKSKTYAKKKVSKSTVQSV